MTKQEFLDRVKVNNVTDNDWGVIEFVYTWHPLISDTMEKEQVAYLYNNFGIGIFNEMYVKANSAKKLNDELYQAQRKVDDILSMIAVLKNE